MLGKTDGMFQCFACLKCMAFGDDGYYDDAFVVDESLLRSPGSLKFAAASVAIKHEATLREDMKTIPKVLEAYVDKLDPQEPGIFYRYFMHKLYSMVQLQLKILCCA